MPERRTCPPWWERWAAWWEAQKIYLVVADPGGSLVYDPTTHHARWRGQLQAAGRRWPVEIAWGPGTPFMAPIIVPVECYSRAHQLRDRSMCLLGPESPAVEYRGVPDLGFWLTRAEGWLEGYAREGWAIDPSWWPLVAAARPEAGYRVSAPPMRLMGLPREWGQGSFEDSGRFRALVSATNGLSAIKAWRPERKGGWREWDRAERLVDGARDVLPGFWIRAEDLRFQDFQRLHAQLGKKLSRKGRRWLLAMGLKLGPSETAWLIHVNEPVPPLAPLDTKGLSAAEVATRVADGVEQFAGQLMRSMTEARMPWRGVVLDNHNLEARRRTGRSDDLHQRISSAQVLLVGLGALGSEVAHLLAQEGVGSFVLVDRDLLLPGNVARHRANLSDAGRPKVTAVQQDIQRINPSATVVVRESWIDEELPRFEWSEGELQQPSVAIGLTGDEASEHVLSEMTGRFGQPCLHAWMEMDGRVLRLFRALPGQDPTLVELGRDPQALIPPLPRSASLASAPQECAEVVAPGSAGNIHAAANFIARVALDVIAGRSDDRNHWLFAPDGVRDAADGIPDALRSRYGVASFRLPRPETIRHASG